MFETCKKTEWSIKIIVVPTIIGALETISKNLKQIEQKIQGKMQMVRTIVLQ